jgi:nucleotide-binding universal stress UspA family protein
MNDFKKILIAIDDGPLAEKIASVGFELSKKVNAEIAVVSVVHTTILNPDGGMSSGEMENMIKSEYKESLQLLLDKVFKTHEIWFFVEQGNPSDVILRVAEEWEADMIVLGTHGRTGLSHLLMGSVAEKIIRHSTKPLFIVPSNK